MANQQPPWLNPQGQPVSQPHPHPFETTKPETSNAINPKVGAAAFAGSIVAVLVWIASLYGIDVPPYIAGELVVIASGLAGYLAPPK